MQPSFLSIERLVIDSVKQFEGNRRDRHAITGISTGFRDVDSITNGLKPGDFIIIGGAPGMGKTTFCLNIALNVALIKQYKRSVFIP